MFNIEIDGITKEIFSPEMLEDDLKQELRTYADEVFRYEVSQGFPEDPVIAVDGSFKKKVKDVKAFGKVELFNKNIDMTESLIACYKRIVDLSPRGAMKHGRFSSVKYADYNYVYHNDFLVARDMNEFRKFLIEKDEEGFDRGDTVLFINVLPYARKIENKGITKATVGRGGKKARHKKSYVTGNQIQRPNGTYYSAQRSMQRLLAGRAIVNPVRYKPYNVSPVAGMKSSFEAERGGGPYLYPTILIKPLIGKGVN